MILSLQDHENLVVERKLRERIVHEGTLFSLILVAALQRQQVKGYEFFTLNGNKVSCDFTDPNNIEKFDEVALPFIKRMLVAASEREMTGITSLFASSPMLYALGHGARDKSYQEIVQHLSGNNPGLRLV